MLSKQIHQSKIWPLMEQTSKRGKPVTFTIDYVKKSTGEVITFKDCWLTSFHSKGSTLNVQCPGENHPRKIRKCLIVRFNGAKVYY